MKILTSRPNFTLQRIEPSFSILGPRRRDFAKAELDLANWMKKNGAAYVERRDGSLPYIAVTLPDEIWDLEVPSRELWPSFKKPSRIQIITYIHHIVVYGQNIHQPRRKRCLWRGYVSYGGWIIKAQLTIPDHLHDLCTLDFDELEFICPTY